MNVSNAEYRKYLALKSFVQNIGIMRATLVSTSPAEILKRIYQELDTTLEILNEENLNKD